MAFLDETGLADFWNQILARLNNFVPAEAGKGLSSNDYTTAEKEKLANIAQGANNYTLPVATASKIGGVKSGTDITVDSSGNVSVNDDSHNHIISNVDGLQSALNDKVPSSRTVNGKALTSDISLTASNVGAISTTDGAVGTNNLASDAVQTEKIAAGAVTREKLAADALYSPIVVCSGPDYDLSQNECGKTLINDHANSSILEYHIGKGNSQWIPAGSEFAFISFDGQGVNLCFWDNILIALPGESSLKNAPLKLRISENYGMVALKKLYHDPEGYGDLWLVTGNVEVIS